MKISVRQLRRLIKEETNKESNDSLDNQVDKYLSQYESEAHRSKNESFRQLTRRLLEAEEGETPVASLEDFDMSAFLDDVTRLVNNYDSLLEVRDTILRRAKNLIASTYGSKGNNAFDRSLREEHGMSIGKSDREFADDEYAAPGGDRAGADVGGGGAP